MRELKAEPAGLPGRAEEMAPTMDERGLSWAATPAARTEAAMTEKRILMELFGWSGSW